MGLLDYLFDPSTYGGQGGLLAGLQQNVAQIPQSQGFSPTFSDRFQPAVDQPLGAPPAQQTFANRFQPAADNPLTAIAPSIPVGGYQMPRLGNVADYTPQQTSPVALPQNAQPTQGQLPMAPQSQQPQQLPPALGGGMSDNPILRTIQSIGNGGGLISALTGNYNDPRSVQQQNMKAQFDATRQALIANGMPASQANSTAMLAVMNPEAAKTILPEALTNKQEFKVIKDALGGEHGYWIDKLSQTMKPADAGDGSGGGALGGGGPAVLAPGVKQYDPTLSGDAYMAQFSPEVQNAAKAYMNGDVQPTGNPRNQGIETLAKKVAQKYGADMGIPVSDALFAEKRKYRTELGTNSPNSAGGQAKAFNQGIDHLSHLATTLEKLDNSNGLGVPIIAQGVNAVRQGISTDQAAISDEAKSLGQTVAGEVGKLFSGSAGGGVHERELTRQRFDTVKSRPQLAAALRATIETMQGGLHALEQRRDSILGPNSGVELVDATTRKKIEEIQGVIDRLEGKAPAATSAGVDRSAIEAEMKRRGLLK